MGQTVENHKMLIISERWPTKVFFSGDTWKLIQFFLINRVSGSAQIMETFSNKHRPLRFEPHLYGEIFLWIVILLSPTHALIA